MSDQSATALHAALKAALARLRAAEADAVSCFAEILRRRLYRELGYSSIHTYAEAELAFSRSKTFQFLQLAEAMNRLPRLSTALAKREISWTKAVSVARVATPSSEQQWLDTARRSGRRELEQRVRESRAQSKGLKLSGQPELLPVLQHPAALPASVVRFELRLEPEQHAKFQALMERLRKQGRSESRENLILLALAAFADDGSESSRLDLATAPYQIVVYRCEACGGARLPDGRPLAPAAAAAAACDCRELRPGQANRASIPPATRRAVLARDGHRCAMPGCGGTHFLEVHHRRPREAGGTNAVENLITLCSACHRLAHQRGDVLLL